MAEGAPKVQVRRNSLSQEWYEAAPAITPDDVERANREYGWRKYRVVADKTEGRTDAASMPRA
jgi:hypothetical protein